MTSCEFLEKTLLGIAKLSVQSHDFGSEVTVIPMSEACNNLAHLYV